MSEKLEQENNELKNRINIMIKTQEEVRKKYESDIQRENYSQRRIEGLEREIEDLRRYI